MSTRRTNENSPAIGAVLLLAEAVRFELTEGYQPSVLFKSTALNHSATLPILPAAPWWLRK